MAMGTGSKPKKEQKTETPLDAEQVKELVALEGELKDLKEQHGIVEEGPLWQRIIQGYYDFRDAHTKLNPVKRKTYLWLCLLSVFGINQFYARHWVKGLLYIAVCWTGISIAMGFIDWMIAVPKEPDENGMIMI
ncbi:MAG: hypothetical protein IJV26_06950 [Lachnospiraceae bacterium]|nr:hypothetical protein [Lachnospiraceae bacterium]